MRRLRQEVMRKFREEEVGGRLVFSLTGSSPIAPEVLVFLRDALQAPTYEGYGSTEAGYVRPAALCCKPLGVANVLQCCMYQLCAGHTSARLARRARPAPPVCVMTGIQVQIPLGVQVCAEGALTAAKQHIAQCG